MIARLIALIAVVAQTQSLGGTILGKVIDPSGGLMPGVTVTAKLDVIGGETYRANTNTKGEFRIDGMKSGRYRVEAELSGFDTIRKENVVVDSGTSTLDFVLFVSTKGWRPADQLFAELLAHIEKTTGPSARNCGEVRLPAQRQPSASHLQEFVDCGLKAAGERAPFRAIQQRQGIDSTVFTGLAGTPDGSIYVFNYDSAPCGNPGGCASSFSISRCAVPGVRTDEYGSVLHCSSR